MAFRRMNWQPAPRNYSRGGGHKEGKPADEPDTGPAPSQASETITKVFQWNSWFLRVFELRASMGFSERIEHDNMMCGEYLALHGPPTGGGGSNDTQDRPSDE